MVSGKGAPGAAVPAEPARAGPVMVRRMGPDELFLYFENRAPGYVFLDEVYFPGWVAELDNDPVRIWQADYAFRAVYAGPGKHVLRFFYRPVSFRIGLWTSIASAASLLLFAFLAGAGNRKDKRLTG